MGFVTCSHFEKEKKAIKKDIPTFKNCNGENIATGTSIATCSDLDSIKQELSTKITEVKNLIDSSTVTKITELETKLTEIKNQINDLNSNHSSSGSVDLTEINNKISQLENSLNNINNSGNSSGEVDLSSIENRLSELERQVNALNTDTTIHTGDGLTGNGTENAPISLLIDDTKLEIKDVDGVKKLTIKEKPCQYRFKIKDVRLPYTISEDDEVLAVPVGGVLTVPKMDKGRSVTVIQTGDGRVTFEASSGLTLEAPFNGTLETAGRNAMVTLMATAPSKVRLTGQTTTPSAQ